MWLAFVVENVITNDRPVNVSELEIKGPLSKAFMLAWPDLA